MASRVGLLLVTMVFVGIAPAQANENDHDNRLIGYSLLSSSLSDESSLNWLRLMREITLHGPAKKIAALMERISKISRQRSKEIEKLRKLNPEVTGSPPPSPIGDAIRNSAKGLGTYEMIFSGGTFDVRFMFLQAQATRMIAVIASQTAKIDPNKTRKIWLREVSQQYEALREEIVTVVKSCQIGASGSSPGS